MKIRFRCSRNSTLPAAASSAPTGTVRQSQVVLVQVFGRARNAFAGGTKMQLNTIYYDPSADAPVIA
jgi:hypothetical protein